MAESFTLVTPSTDLVRPSTAAGGDWTWGGLTAEVWRVLANPEGTKSLPTLDWIEQNVPSSSDDPSFLPKFDAHVSLWSAILEILQYSFGWRSPAHGMARWVNEGMPVDDVRFQVITHLLGRQPRERAINLAAFLFKQEGWKLSLYGIGGLKQTYGLMNSENPEKVPLWVEEEYERRMRGPSSHELETVRLPCSGGGWDNLHLVGHAWTPIARTAQEQNAPARGFAGDAESKPRFVASDEGEHGTAVLITDTYRSWYEDLYRFAAQLAPLKNGRSRKVDVLCTPIGWLGTFRQSRETHLWFAGPHSLHTWGEVNSLD